MVSAKQEIIQRLLDSLTRSRHELIECNFTEETICHCECHLSGGSSCSSCSPSRMKRLLFESLINTEIEAGRLLVYLRRTEN